jgi:hypothetical protein
VFGAGFDLHEDQKVVTGGDDIDLASARPEIPGNDGIALVGQKFGGKILPNMEYFFCFLLLHAAKKSLTDNLSTILMTQD